MMLHIISGETIYAPNGFGSSDRYGGTVGACGPVGAIPSVVQATVDVLYLPLAGLARSGYL
ncbi:hypothetical protein, partial [Salmonella enterica]|uniref:hypothetical protein n=1 Tax=Salmonella enterica TaxID=28901 RepID=UPI001C98EB42